jgi:prepilin-type N-terminal cleavage/methylation domain-containing protein
MIFCKQKNKLKRCLNKKGMSLVEIMVAFSILSVAFMAISYSFPFGLTINKSAENLTIASFLAQDKVEEIISLGYENISVGNIESRNRLSDDGDDYRFVYEREANVFYVDSNLNFSVDDYGLKKISVTVYYINSISKQADSYNITTLISKR